MSFVRRITAAKHLKALKAAPTLSSTELAEVQSKLLEKGEGVIGPLSALLSNNDARRPALEVLGQLLSHATLPRFVEQLRSEDPQVVSGIVECMSSSKNFAPAQLLDVMVNDVEIRTQAERVLNAHVERLGPKRIAEHLQAADRELKRQLLRLLEQVVDETVAPDLARMGQDGDWQARSQAARLIARLPEEHAVEPLAALLRDVHSAVRREAVLGLGTVSGQQVIAPLCSALRDGDLKVQTAAIDALIQLDDAGAVMHLVEVLKDPSEYARRSAVEVLNAVATKDAIQDLVKALSDEDWWVRVRAADALGAIGGSRVVDAAMELMHNEDVFIRRYAVEILNTTVDKRSVPMLIEALQDTDWWVRERSIDALGKTGDSRATEHLIYLMAMDNDAAPHCVKALAAIADDGALQALVGLVENADSELCHLAAEGLTEASKRGIQGPMAEHVAAVLRADGRRATGGRPFGGLRSTSAVIKNDFDAMRKTGLVPDDLGAARTPVTPPPPGVGPASGVDPVSAAGPPSNVAPASSAGAQPSPAPPAGGDGQRLDYSRLESGSILLDRYEVVRLIGRGGFGAVYLTNDIEVEEQIILKVLNPSISSDDAVIRRFVQELKYTRRITHPNVIRLYDFLRFDWAYAISMEYFEGVNLGQFLRKKGRVDLQRASHLLRQICAGLSAAHKQGIIHRDIKPQNVLVGRDGTVKIVDFGLASITHDAGSRLTRSGFIVGTPQYMAPEQIKGGKIDPRTDIYSLGVLFYELLVGKPPFEGDTAVNIIYQHLQDAPEPPSKLVPGLPEWVDRMVLHMLEKVPDRRPATAREIMEDGQLKAA